MNVRYRVELSQAEREQLAALLSGGKHAAWKLKRAQILLADAGACDEAIVNAARSFLICAEVKFPRQSSVSISRPADREHAFLAADRGVAAALSGTVA